MPLAKKTLSQALSGQRRLKDIPEAALRAATTVHFRFTAKEVALLKRLSCAFDPTGARAGRLARRGFSKAEVIQACRDLKRYAGGDLRALESLAVYRRAGLDLRHYASFRRSGKSLTAYYNREHIGGRGLSIAGWVLTVTSALFLGGALVSLAALGIISARCAARPDACGCDGPDIGIVGLAVTTSLSITSGVGGLLFLLPGLPLLIVGENRVRTWLRGDLLDVGHVRDLDRFRERYVHGPRRSVVRAAVSPLVTRQGAGLALTLQW